MVSGGWWVVSDSGDGVDAAGKRSEIEAVNDSVHSTQYSVLVLSTEY